MAHISALIKKLLPWSIVLLLAIPGNAICVPDLVNFTPTPTISWDPVPSANLAGYKLYSVVGGVPFLLLKDIPCVSWIDDETLQSRFYCQGQSDSIPYPEQRATNTELDSLDLCVKAYKTSGVESIDCSNIITICQPDIWHPGEVYN